MSLNTVFYKDKDEEAYFEKKLCYISTQIFVLQSTYNLAVVDISGLLVGASYRFVIEIWISQFLPATLGALLSSSTGIVRSLSGSR